MNCRISAALFIRDGEIVVGPEVIEPEPAGYGTLKPVWTFMCEVLLKRRLC